MIDVPSAETQFDIDEFNDLYARTKPTLYIKMTDIISIHHIVAGDLPTICPSQDDILREVIRELGSAQNNEHELKHVSTSEICLTLNPKLHNKEGRVHCCHCNRLLRDTDKLTKIPTPKVKRFSWRRNVASSTSSGSSLAPTSWKSW